MLWMRRQRTGQQPDLYPLADFLRRLRELSFEDAKRVEAAVIECGMGRSEEWARAVRQLQIASMQADRDLQRQAGGRHAQSAFSESKARNRVDPIVLYAAGVAGEALAIRQMLDPETWAYVTRPWREVLLLPEYGESGVGNRPAVSRRSRGRTTSQKTPMSLIRRRLGHRHRSRRRPRLLSWVRRSRCRLWGRCAFCAYREKGQQWRRCPLAWAGRTSRRG